MQDSIGTRAIPDVLARKLESLDIVGLCHKLKTISERTLPIGAGYAYATLSNGELQIWYHVSDMEYPMVQRHGILLFRTNSDLNAMAFASTEKSPTTAPSYIVDRLCPALEKFFTEELGWIPASY